MRKATIFTFLATTLVTGTVAGCSAGLFKKRSHDSSPSKETGEIDAEPDPEEIYPEPPIDSSTPRRLTPEEYANAVLDVLKVDVGDLLSSFPLEASTSGFRNQSDAFQISLAHVQWFANSARAVGERTIVLDCKDTGPVCGAAFVSRVGRMLFRRPLTDDEAKAFRDLGAATSEEFQNYESGARTILEAMLQSPQFLYRIETMDEGENVRPLDGYEMASRLAFFVWHSVPDGKLLEAAAAKSLDTPEGIAAEVDRMLADTRARRGFRSFVSEWLQLNRLATVDREPAQFPGFSKDLLKEMNDETLALFEDAAFGESSDLLSVFKAGHTFATPGVAALYGLESRGDGVLRYDFAADSPRTGFLSLSAFLTLSSATVNSDPVARGHLVSDRFLCVKTPQAPAGIALPGETAEAPKTKRQRYEIHRDNPSCTGCHKNMDPIGFAFEAFDTLGRFRALDESQTAVDASGEFPEKGVKVTFSDAKDLGQKLADSGGVKACISRRVLEYAVGFRVKKDSVELTGVTQAFVDAKGKYQDLVKAVAVSGLFRYISDKGEEQ